ncbi:putative organic cation/carnitine transporter 4-like [Capsicum annuum]|nr:putative organic cation/carnitine transporter 4-like [Capsicum annuum]
MLPAEKLNGVKQENSEFDEQDNGLINQEDMEKLKLEEQTSSETEVFDLSRKHQSVIKSWSSLISSPELTKYHLSLSANNNKDYTNHSVMLRIAQPELNLKECPIMEETNLDYHMKKSGIDCVIKGSVNGLIYVVNEAKELFLWNPAIKKYKKLPDFRTKLKDDGQCTYGFGYDDIHDDYKVVCIFTLTCYPRNFQEINICSLKDDSWRTMHCSRRVTWLIGSVVHQIIIWIKEAKQWRQDFKISERQGRQWNMNFEGCGKGAGKKKTEILAYWDEEWERQLLSQVYN